MSKKFFLIGVTGFLICVIPACRQAGVLFAQEQLTITTYYPSPYGSYNELQLYPHSSPVTACNATTRGTMYYDSDDNQIKVCDGTSWTNLGGGGYWTLFGSSLYPNDTAWNVGIGTTPGAGYKLDVAGTIRGTDITCVDCLGPSDIGDGLGVSEIDETQIQRRVSGSCPAAGSGSSIRVINLDGSVVCDTDDVGAAGGGITSINTMTGPAISIAAGSGISISNASNTVTITNTGGVGGGVSGSGTVNYIPKWTDVTSLGNSEISQSGSGRIGIGIAGGTPGYKFSVDGHIKTDYNVYGAQLCIAGDCRSTWPGGGPTCTWYSATSNNKSVGVYCPSGTSAMSGGCEGCSSGTEWKACRRDFNGWLFNAEDVGWYPGCPWRTYVSVLCCSGLTVTN